MGSTFSDQTKKLSALLQLLRAPKSAYLPLPKSLTEAAVHGDLKASQMFIERGASIKERSIGYASPLHAACSFGHIEIAKLLHSLGGPLKAEGEMFSCIHFAAGKGFIEIVRWALDSGLPVADCPSALSNAAINGQLEVVQLLLERGVDPQNAKIYGSGANKRTPSHFARNAGFTALADLLDGKEFDSSKHLKEAKKRFDTSNPAALEPPRVEANKREETIQEALRIIEELSNPDELDPDGFPLLLLAVSSCEVSLIRALLGSGASPNTRSGVGGSTALIEATSLGKGELIELLLEHGAEINQGDGSGKTPLMAAVAKGDPEIVELLLKHGADPKLKDSTGKSALKYVEGLHSEKISELLKQKRAKKK